MSHPFTGPAAVLALLGCLSTAAVVVADDGSGGDDPGPPLSLHAAIARTLAQSPELAVHPLRLRAQQARVDAAARRPPPRLDAGVENVLGSGDARGLRSAEATLALSQVIELGARRDRRIDAAQATLDVLDLERSIARLDTVAEVGRRFIHVASDERQLGLTRLATQLAQRTVTEVERRVRSARAPEVELHRARIRQVRAGIEQEHAEHELLSSRRRLAAMWGARTADFGAVRADLFDLPEAQDGPALVARLAAGPDFLHFASEARQREAEVRLAQARASGEVTLSAGLRRREDRDDTSIVAGLSLPLFTARQARPELDLAHARREQVEPRRQAARVRAEASLYALVQELQHSITEARALRDDVLPQMQAVLEATEAAWRSGRYGYLEWTGVQAERLEVERALIRASANAHLFRIEIERLTGAATGRQTEPAGDPR